MDIYTSAGWFIDRVANGAAYRTCFTEFKSAICYIILRKPDLALAAFDAAVTEMGSDLMWMSSGEPNCIIEAYALSRRTAEPERVRSLLAHFARQNTSNSALFHYTLILAGLLWPDYANPHVHTLTILNMKQFKYLNAVSRYALCILDGRDPAEDAKRLFKSSRLHNIHRYSNSGDPRGFVCLPFLSISASTNIWPMMANWQGANRLSAEFLEYRKSCMAGTGVDSSPDTPTR